jgi:hypothetical protein
MNQSDARSIILSKWQQFDTKSFPATYMDMRHFYDWLEKAHPELLRFKSKDEKWQIVHIWLIQAGPH